MGLSAVILQVLEGCDLLIYLLIIGFILALVFSVVFRTIVSHPLSSAFYAVKDVYHYFKYHQWDNMQTGKIIAYVALFGKGKTLSVVHYICAQYFKYNNKKVFDFNRKKWVTQKVHIISNVDLSDVPYERFESLSQIVNVAETFSKKDMENDTLTVTLVLGDEFSVQLNSRNFKSNIDALFLNTLLTCRHHHITLVYDAQRFNHVDALLRQVTSYVVSCNKVWRIMVSEKYDAWELENATTVSNIKPMARFGWFIKDKDYNAYDTLACVGNLAKSCKEGDMLSEDEILNLQCNNGVQMEAVEKPSRRFIRNMKKQR